MSALNHRDRELVALGAALAANCLSCVEYHVAEARKAGLTDIEIAAAIELADKIRRVPAAKVLETANATLSRVPQAAGSASACCAPASAPTAGKACC